LCPPWILDIDVTVKLLYGHQQGAEIVYNPQKPGRPSHVDHRYFEVNLRISLGVEVRPGNEHAPAKGLPGLWQMVDWIEETKDPLASPWTRVELLGEPSASSVLS
jgi:hypothetical protein